MRYLQRIILLCTAFVFLISLAVAVPVDVNIKDEVGGTIEYLAYDKNVTGVQTFTLQWYNHRSISCSTRAEYVLYNNTNNTEKITSVWTEKKPMHPGVSDVFTAHWLPPYNSTFAAVLRIHRCFDIIEQPIGNFTVVRPADEQAIELTAENKPGAQIEITLTADQPLRNVVVTPTSTYPNWIIESATVETVTPGEETTAVVQYEPAVWKEEEIELRAVTTDGRYTSDPLTVTVKKEQTFWEKHGSKILLLLLSALIITNAYFFTNR